MLVMLAWPETAEISLPEWTVLWYLSHCTVTFISSYCFSKQHAIPHDCRFLLGIGGDVTGEDMGALHGRSFLGASQVPSEPEADRKPLQHDSLFWPSRLHTIHRHMHISSGVLFANLISPFPLSYRILPRSSGEQKQPSNSSL